MGRAVAPPKAKRRRKGLPSPKPWRGSEPENTRQTVLLAGMDCQQGQMDLFQTDGATTEC